MSHPFTLTEIPSDANILELHAAYPNHSPEFLFDCFVQPDLLQRWWVPQPMIDARQNGNYKFRWVEMDWTLVGTLLDFEPGSHLKFTWQWEHAPELPQRIVEIFFDPAPTGTLLRLTHRTYDASPRDIEDRENHRTGWHHFLQQLSRVPAGTLPVTSEAL